MNKKLIIALVILSVVGAGIFYFLTTGNIGAKYNTVEAKKGEVAKYVDEVGIISSKNIRNYYGNNSRIEKMDLKLGDYVEKGQILIKFEENIDLEAEKIKKQIQALRASYNEALSPVDSQSISNAKINIDSIKSKIDFKNENKNIIEELYNNGAVPESELKQVNYELEQLGHNLSIAKNNYNQLLKGLSNNIKAKYQAEIDALNISLKTLENSRDNYVICADFNGVVTEVNAFEGDIPSSGLMILEIMDPKEKNIVVDFIAEDASIIRPGMKAKVNAEDLGIQIDNIEVEKIHPKSFITYSELGVEENRQRIELNIPHFKEEYSLGFKVETKVMIEEPRETLFIPEDAIYEKDLKKYVDVLEDKKPIEREVVTGIKDDRDIEIKEGLKEGDKVILHYEKK